MLTIGNTTIQPGCQVLHECLDPSAYDANGDGEIGNDEVRMFCDQKCNPPWDGVESIVPAWDPPGPGTHVLWSCSALPSSSVVQTNSCSPPSEVKSYGENLDIAPGFSATLTTQPGSGSASGSGVDLIVTGEEVHPESRLELRFSVDECRRGGIDGGSCRLVLSHLELASASTLVAGDYEVGDISLELAQPVAADVDFSSCAHGECTGSFSFSEVQANSILTTLRWSQQPVGGGAVGEGAVTIGNGVDALGGVESLTGTLSLAPDASGGSIRVTGVGRDHLGGDWAQVQFTLQGSVQPLQ